MDDELTEREARLIKNCLDYASGDPAGLPGHNLMILVAKLARRKVQLEAVAARAYDVDQLISEFYPDYPDAITEGLDYLEIALLDVGYQFPGSV